MESGEEDGPEVDDLLGKAARVDALDRQHVLAQVEQGLFKRPTRPITLGRYVLLERLGAGGGGVVHAAYDTELNRRVAIKLLRASPEGTRDASEAEAHLVAEAQAMAQLSDPNVIPVYDMGRYEPPDLGLPADATDVEIPRQGVFVVMEFVDGVDGKQWLELRRRDWREVLDVFVAAGRGLAAAHEHGLVHRDFKPANVLVGQDGRVRVLDFGLAREVVPQSGDVALDDEDLGILQTKTGFVRGTPVYMSPEQHRGASIDPRSDQFAFCVSLFEALYGERPFAGDSMRALRKAKNAGAPAPKADRDVPRWLADVVRRGLSPRPEDRFEDMRALVDRLEQDRSARRKTVALVGVLLAVASTIGITAAQPQRVDPCIASRASIDEAWGPDARASLEQRIEESGRPFAKHTWKALSARLDESAKTWGQVHDEVCPAQTGDPNPPMHCLVEWRDRVAALVKALGSDDPKAIEYAAPAVLDLADPKRCAEADARTVPPQPGDDKPQAVEALRRQLLETEQLLATGQASAADQMVAAAQVNAESISFSSVQDETRYWQGRTKYELGEYAEADALLRGTFWNASGEGRDILAASVAIQLVRVSGRLAKVEAAHDWAAHARSTLVRLGEPHPAPLLHARLDAALGELALHTGQGQLASDHYDDARSILARELGSDSLRVGLVLEKIGDAKDRGDRAQKHYDAAMTILQGTLGPEHPWVGRLHYKLGNTLRYTKRPERAREHLETAAEILEKGRPDDPALAEIYERLALLSSRLEDDEASKAYAARGHEIRQTVRARVDPLGAGACDPSDMYVLLDRSYGMLMGIDHEVPKDSWKSSKFWIALDAVQRVVQRFQDRIRFGLILFPHDKGLGVCAPMIDPCWDEPHPLPESAAHNCAKENRLVCQNPGAEVAVPIQPRAAAAIGGMDALKTPLCWGTPTVRALALAAEELAAIAQPGRPQSIMLVTDGEFHCGSYLPAVEALAAAGVRVYPVGFTDVPQSEWRAGLNDVACAARTAPEFPRGCYERDGHWRAIDPKGPALFRSVASEEEVGVALNDIATGAACIPW